MVSLNGKQLKGTQVRENKVWGRAQNTKPLLEVRLVPVITLPFASGS